MIMYADSACLDLYIIKLNLKKNKYYQSMIWTQNFNGKKVNN